MGNNLCKFTTAKPIQFPRKPEKVWCKFCVFRLGSADHFGICRLAANKNNVVVEHSAYKQEKLSAHSQYVWAERNVVLILGFSIYAVNHMYWHGRVLCRLNDFSWVYAAHIVFRNHSKKMRCVGLHVFRIISPSLLPATQIVVTFGELKSLVFCLFCYTHTAFILRHFLCCQQAFFSFLRVIRSSECLGLRTHCFYFLTMNGKISIEMNT